MAGELETVSNNNGRPGENDPGYSDQDDNSLAARVRGRLRRPVSPIRKWKEFLVEKLLFACGAVSTLAIILIFIFLFKEGIIALQKVSPLSDFFYSTTIEQEYDAATDEMVTIGEKTDFVWSPASEPPRVSIIPLLWGSLGIAVITAIISTLAGVAVGVYLSEMSSTRMRNIIKPMLELLVGIPTVVVGFFMLAVIAIPLKHFANSVGLGRFYISPYNMFIGALGVSVVIIPVIASLVDDALRAVPNDLRAASLSLGSTRWQTTWRVVLPAGISGVSAAVILGFGRAMGETMIVLMCAGNAPQLFNPDTPVLSEPFSAVRTMTASIAAEMGTAAQGSIWYHTLFFIGALLVSITFVLNIVVELIVNKYRKKIRL